MEALILFGLAENIFAYLSMSDMDLNEIFGLSKTLFSKTLDHGTESPERIVPSQNLKKAIKAENNSN